MTLGWFHEPLLQHTPCPKSFLNLLFVLTCQDTYFPLVWGLLVGRDSVLLIFVSWCLAQSFWNWTERSERKGSASESIAVPVLALPLLMPWLLLSLWTHHSGLLTEWSYSTSVQGLFCRREREQPLGVWHVWPCHQKVLLLAYFFFFLYILQDNSNFFSYLKFTSNFLLLWFGDLNGHNCGHKLTLGYSMHSFPWSSLISSAIYLPFLDRENGALFFSYFLWVISFYLTLRIVKCSSASISASHFPYLSPQFPSCFHLAQIFNFPLNFLL